jgi:hypothetical protein
MKNDLPFDLLIRVTEQLTGQPVVLPSTSEPRHLDTATRSLMGIPPETPGEISKLNRALDYLSPDAKRGNGRLFDSDGQPLNDYWLGVVWAIRGLGWNSGQQICGGLGQLQVQSPESRNNQFSLQTSEARGLV